MAYEDFFNQYLSNRFGQYDSTDAYLKNRFPQFNRPETQANVETKPVTQTITTDPKTGEQTMTVKGSVQDLSAANPNTPTVLPAGGYRNLGNSADRTPVAYQRPEGGQTQDLLYRPQPVDPNRPIWNDYQDQNRVPAVPGAPVPPAAAQANVPAVPQDYNARVGQMESGNNPNIGYHDRSKSSAYGQYGITNAAWQDIQRANPKFAGRDITTLTPAEQNEAMNTFTGQNAKYLQNYGVEPTQANLSLAHFLGAKGASDYLKTGAISPEAAVANGGEERVRQIAQQRLGAGQPQRPGMMQASLQQNGPAVPQTYPPGQQPTAVETSIATQTGRPLVEQAGPSEQFMNPEDKAARDKFIAAQSSGRPADFAAIIADGNQPDWVRAAAGRAYYDAETLNKKQRETAQTVEQKLATPGGDKWLAAQLASKKEEGSYVKAYLFSRLGLNDLAKQEQQRLGAGTTWETVMLEDGTPGIMQVSADGLPITGYTPKGEMTASQLVQFGGGNAKALDIVGGSFVNDTTGEVGRLMTDKRTGKSYIQTDTGRKSMTGWRPQSSMGTFGSAEEMAARKAAGGVTGAKTEFTGRTGTGNLTGYPNVPTAPAGQVAPVGGTTGTQVQGGGQVTGGGYVAPGAAQPVQGGATLSELKTGQAVTGKEQEMFLKTKQDISKNSGEGREVADTTRTQINDLMNSPEMIGYLTADAGTPGARAAKLMREVITGSYSGEGQGKELADKMRELSIPPALQSKIEAYRQSNTRINALTLRSNEGPGAISNFENKQNQNNNMTNIGDLTPWSALNGLGKRQFIGDIAMAKQQFLAANEGLYKSDTQFERVWGKERDKLMKGYEGIYAARLKAIQPYYEASMKNPSSAQAQQQYRDAAVAAFRTYPTPDYNAQTGKWEYKTKEARMAAMSAIAGGQ